MGSCVSSSVNETPFTVRKHRLSFRSSNHVVPSSSRTSPVKEKTSTVDASVAVDDAVVNSPLCQTRNQTSFSDFGSKEEIFFQSYPWLESDREDDDFFSVNGDFTPSRGSTPLHHNFSIQLPNHHKPGPSSNEKTQKSLFELFKESIRENLYNNDDDDQVYIAAPSTNDRPSTSVNSSPYFSGATSSVCGSTPTRLALKTNHDDKLSDRSVQCCIPKLFSSRSLIDKKNSMMIDHH